MVGRKKVFEVNLSQAERDHLKNLVSVGEEKARRLTRARILLKASAGWTDQQIHEALDVGEATVGRIRKRYSEEGLDVALNRRPTSRQYERKIDGKTEAHLIAMTCGDAPEGYARWSLRLLSERLSAKAKIRSNPNTHHRYFSTFATFFRREIPSQ